MEVIKAILARHSAHDFRSKPIPQEIIMKIMEVATHSPSGVMAAGKTPSEDEKEVYVGRLNYTKGMRPKY